MCAPTHGMHSDRCSVIIKFIIILIPRTPTYKMTFRSYPAAAIRLTISKRIDDTDIGNRNRFLTATIFYIHILDKIVKYYYLYIHQGIRNFPLYSRHHRTHDVRVAVGFAFRIVTHCEYFVTLQMSTIQLCFHRVIRNDISTKKIRQKFV